MLTVSISSAFGQKPRPRTAPKATSATTKKPATKAVAKGSIQLEAGLVFNSGDVKPVGRATFYLLKEDAKKVIITQEHLDLFNNDSSRLSVTRNPTLENWSLYGAVLYMDGSLAPTFATTVKNDLDKVKVATTTTGFDGKATFDNVPVGDYYIFGVYKFGKQTTYWNLPISVKAGGNKIILDNENMRG
jgi:hypothetical protein